MAKRSGYSSLADIFARRGDPWVSDKEGMRDYGRNMETENAEYDFDHRFHNTGSAFKPTVATPKPVHRDPVPSRNVEPDFAKRRANILAASKKRRNGLLIKK
jgi:hypothetical protein